MQKADKIEVIKTLEELIGSYSGEDIFEEVFKLIFVKLYSEKTKKTMNIELFNEAIKTWKGVFEDNSKINLTSGLLQKCIPLIEGINFSQDRDLDILDSLFEYLINKGSKKNKGQYFTPKNVIKMCVKMLNPKPNEYVIDPACGSGGFLIHTLYWVEDKYLKNEPLNFKGDYAEKHLFGIDFDINTLRIAKLLMYVNDVINSNLYKNNSLEKLNNIKNLFFDIVMTNPPFGGKVEDLEILKNYELGKNKERLEKHILFIEKSLNLLRPGGRMVIILPQGVLNNTSLEWVRKWILEKARILAVVGLHENTFKPHTGTKTSALFIQKWNNDPKLGPLCPYQKDYPIFMAVSQKSGKDNSGNYVYQKDNKTLDDDLNEIADNFIKFIKNEKLHFWS